MSTPWTSKEDAILSRLWAKRMPAPEIAKRLPGRNGRAVQIRATRLMARGELQSRHCTDVAAWSPEEEAAIIDARNRGISYARISRDILPGRTLHAIETRAQRLIARGALEARNGYRQPLVVAPRRDDAERGAAGLLRRQLETGQHNITCPQRYRETCALVGLAA